MSTKAADECTPAVRDERELAAWALYADTLRDLGPVAYAAAEPPAWDHLLQTLAEVGLTPPAGAGAPPAP